MGSQCENAACKLSNSPREVLSFEIENVRLLANEREKKKRRPRSTVNQSDAWSLESFVVEELKKNVLCVARKLTRRRNAVTIGRSGLATPLRTRVLNRCVLSVETTKRIEIKRNAIFSR